MLFIMYTILCLVRSYAHEFSACYALFSRFLGSAQKPPGGHACAARRFICLCIIFGSGCLNRLAGMNIRQAAQQCCVFLLVRVLCRGMGTSDCDFIHFDSMNWLKLGV